MVTGRGNRSKDGQKGLSTVQVHSIIRLYFGLTIAPEAEYRLDVRELSDVGKMLLCLMDEYYRGVSKGSMKTVQNIIHFIFKNLL